MLAALLDTNVYLVFLLLHLVFVVVAFGGNFVQPMLARSGTEPAALAKAALYVQLPALVLMWVTGMGLAGIGELKIAEEGWIIAALVLFVIAAVVQFLVGRAWRSGDPKLVPALTGVLHLSLVVGLYLMIFKPGRPG